MHTTKQSFGYCHITIRPQSLTALLQTNNERAFLVAQLQDLLSPRLILEDIPPHRQLASCIDLLAFSITPSAVHLLAFAIDMTIAADFAHRLFARLSQYQYTMRAPYASVSPEVSIRVRKLNGPHQALAHSLRIHHLHTDWEYDRYSSIGFYLHDRRGDWMRIWRLSQLYDNAPSHYAGLMQRQTSLNASHAHE